MATPNLELETVPTDPFAAKHAVERNFDKIDAALGDVAGVSVLDEAAGDPVDGDLAAKLTAMEARIVALEVALETA